MEHFVEFNQPNNRIFYRNKLINMGYELYNCHEDDFDTLQIIEIDSMLFVYDNYIIDTDETPGFESLMHQIKCNNFVNRFNYQIAGVCNFSDMSIFRATENIYHARGEGFYVKIKKDTKDLFMTEDDKEHQAIITSFADYYELILHTIDRSSFRNI